MEVGIDTLDNRVVELDTVKANQSTMNSVVQSITYNESNGVLTITKVNGTSTNIDTKLEKLAVNFSYNPTTQQLDITLDDGTVQHVDMSALVTQYEFLDSDTVDFTVQSDGKIRASIIPGSITGAMLQPNYLADIIVQANIATAQAVIATDAADDALGYKNETEAFKNQAKQYRDEAQGIVGVGIADKVVPGLVRGSGNVEIEADGDMWANPYMDKATIADTAFAHFTTADNGLAELFLNGKSYQNVTVEGKNKFDKAKVTAVRYIQPITGVVTTSSYNNNVSQLIPVTVGSAYTISGHTFVQPNTPVGIAWYNSSGVFISGTTYQNATGNGTYTAPTGAAFVRYTINNVDLNTSQLELGSTATAYASYVGNSPSPDYPAPITPFNASGTAKARATRKNLLPKFSNQILSGVTMTVDSDGTIHLNGTATGNIFFYADNANSQNLMFISGDYALSLNNPSIAPLTFCFARRDSEASPYSITLNADTIDKKATATRTGNQVFLANRCYIYIASGSVLNNAILKPQLELGTVATPYETPKSNEAPITFSGYDLLNGVKDTPDYTRTAKYVITSNDIISLDTVTSAIVDFVNIRYTNMTGIVIPTVQDSEAKSMLTSVSTPRNNVLAPYKHWKAPSNWQIGFEKGKYATLADARNAYVGTVVIYELATYIPHTPSRLFVQTYATETNISIIDPVQTTFTAVAKSELWSRDYLQDVGIADTKNSTVTFTQASADAELVSGSTHATLWGLVKKKLADIVTALADKVNTADKATTDTENNTNKWLAANVGYTLGKEIDDIYSRINGTNPAPDANTLTIAGTYTIVPETINTPVSTWGIIDVKTGANGQWVFQEFRFTSGGMHERQYINGVWSTWTSRY
jgi:hypothetical protein